MNKDPYVWAKEKINFFLEKTEIVKNVDLKKSPGNIWSIKKLLALDYYIGGSHVLFKKNFENWYYVDTHCGSGLIGFEKDLKLERFPGSPLIAALRANNQPFTDYFFSDMDGESINSLNKVLHILKLHVGNRTYSPTVQNFEITADHVRRYKKWGNAFLIFIDPVGFTEIRWSIMKKFLEIETADIFLTFMTSFIALNRTNAHPGTEYEKTFDEVYGIPDWRNETGTDALLELYLDQIRKFRKYVYTIPVHRVGENRLYDIIIATNSRGAGEIIDYTRKIMEVLTTELIEAALKVTTKKDTDLDKWFEQPA